MVHTTYHDFLTTHLPAIKVHGPPRRIRVCKCDYSVVATFLLLAKARLGQIFGRNADAQRGAHTDQDDLAALFEELGHVRLVEVRTDLRDKLVASQGRKETEHTFPT